jgi:hypothetical protein
MKAWQVNGDWRAHSSGKTYCFSFTVICEDDEDPVAVIHKKTIKSGFTYLRGEVKHLDLPIVIENKT